MSIIDDSRLKDLTAAESSRYSRHLLLPEVSLEGQKRLKASKVLIVGAGGLGSPLALYLAAAGVGSIGIVDFDFVEDSNLQRQIIHSTKDIGRPKTASAKDRIRGLNPYVNVITHAISLTSQNALDILHDYDVVVDGTDNFQTRYLLNDACVLLDIPNVYGSINQF
jgi:adenylyltransferase/sulfurtransferase